MNTFTITDIRDSTPWLDTSEYLPDGWSGTALDILRNENIDPNTRIWIVTKIDSALSELEISQFLVQIVLPLARRYADKLGAAVIDTVLELHKQRLIGNEPTQQEWVAASAAGWYATQSPKDETAGIVTAMATKKKDAVIAAGRAAYAEIIKRTAHIDSKNAPSDPIVRSAIRTARRVAELSVYTEMVYDLVMLLEKNNKPSDNSSPI